MARVQSVWVPRTPSKTSSWAFAEGHPRGKMGHGIVLLVFGCPWSSCGCFSSAGCAVPNGTSWRSRSSCSARGLGPPSSDNTPGVATSRPCGLRWVESADVEGSPGWFFVQPETLLRWRRDLVRRRRTYRRALRDGPHCPPESPAGARIGFSVTPGAGGGNRTHDLTITNRLRYQLRHTGLKPSGPDSSGILPVESR